MRQVLNATQAFPFFVTKKEPQTARRPGTKYTSQTTSKLHPNNQLNANPNLAERIDTINAIHAGYCYLLIGVWILSSHIFSLSNAFGQVYYFALLIYTVYFYLFKEPKTGLYKNEPSGHSILRDLIFGFHFFKDFCFMLFTLQLESIFVYLISYVNPNKFNSNETALNDTVRMFFESFADPKYNITMFNNTYNLYKDIWLYYLCKLYIPTTSFIFVLWVVLLTFANVQHPMIRCFKLLQKFCRCVGYGRLLRIASFITTILPSSRYACHIQRFTAYGGYDGVPQSLKSGQWWEEPTTWYKIVTWKTGGGCNDLVFSGHMIIIVSTLMVFSESLIVNLNFFNNIVKNKKNKVQILSENSSVYQNKVKIQRHIKIVKIGMYLIVGYLWWLSMLSGLKMITEKHHYSVDVVLAYIITALVYYFIGARNTATNQTSTNKVYNIAGQNITAINIENGENMANSVNSNVIENNYDREPCWYIDILSFPRYNDWVNNRNNIQNYNWTARKIMQLDVYHHSKKDTHSSLISKQLHLGYQWYLLTCMLCPLLFVFVFVLPYT